MERSEVEDAPDKPVTLEEQLDRLCEYYMSIGVPYDVFWHGDYCCLKYYEAVYMKKRKIHNEEMWMMGMYNYVAHATTLSNAFKSKGQNPSEYLKQPMDFFPKTEEEEKEEAERMKQQIISNLNRIKAQWDKKEQGKTDVNTNSESGNKNTGQRNRGSRKGKQSGRSTEKTS